MMTNKGRRNARAEKSAFGREIAGQVAVDHV